MASIIKLANKLPRIALPTAFPNGQAAQWTTDPYFETTVNGSPWIQGNLAFPNAAMAKAIGMEFPSGVAYQGMFTQNISPFIGLSKIYLEIDDLKGVVLINASESSKITSPGAYIIEQAYASMGSIWYYLDDAYFCPDPSFKTVAEGALPTTGGENAWISTTGNARKGAGGNIYLNTSASAGTILLRLKNVWTPSKALVFNITVDYVPPGAALRVYGASGAALIDITAPGRYEAEATMGAGGGEMPTIASLTPALGEAVVSRFFVRLKTQQWSIEGNQFSRPSALWMAEKSIFDQIIDPKYQVSSNQYSRDNLASAIQPNTPQLGYSGYLPPAGMYRVGDTIYNPSGSPSGWRCVQAGNPGVWAALPTL